MSKGCLTSLLSLVVLLPCGLRAQGGYNSLTAHSYLTAHDPNGAVRYASAWTKAEPDNFSAWAALGAAYGAGLHQPANAVAAFERALAIRPDSAECLNAIGVENFNQSHFAEAVTAFKRATELAPAKSHYWNNLTAAYSATNNRSGALQALESNQALAAPHGTWMDWYVLGNGFNHQMDYAKAIYAYQQSLRLNPQQGATWTNLGSAEQSSGQWDRALKDFKRGEELGNPLGGQNYNALRNAIVQAESRARAASPSNGNSMAAFNRVREGQMRSWNANHPANLWLSGTDRPN